MPSTPRLGLGLLASGQTEPEIPHNAGLNRLDSFVGLNIENRTLTAPPAAVNGESYIVATGGTGVWTGKDGKLAIYYEGQWTYITPQMGMLAWLKLEGFMIRYTANGWEAITGECMYVGRVTANDVYTVWEGIDWDTDDRLDSNYVKASTSLITLKEIGWYHIEVDVTIEQTASAAYNFSEIQAVLAGGVIPGSLRRTTTHFGNINKMSMHLSITFYSNATNQNLEIQVQRHTGAGTLQVAANGATIKITRV